MAKKKFHRDVLYYLLIIARSVLYVLPYRFGFWFSGAAGRLAFALITRERNKTLSHLRLAFGQEKSEKELREIGKKMFQHYGRIAFELNMMDKIIPNIDQFVSIEGREHLDKAVAMGKGVVGIISHIGNWEMLGGTLALKGYISSVFARRIYYDRYNEMLVALRTRFGEQTLYRDGSPRLILKALKENRIVGFVVDQDVQEVDGVYAQFFNRPAYSPSAPVRFSLTTGAPMLPMFIVRGEGMKHRIIIEPVIELTATQDKLNDVLVNTQKWVSIQEKYIRQYPELWVWNHKRWKSAPKNPTPALN